MSSEVMIAAVIKEFGKKISIEKVAIPKPKKKEVLVKVKASGLCGTDLHMLDGKIPTVQLPHIPGHELAGEIYELGEEVTGFEVGDNVVSAIDVTCGICGFCITGRGNLCKNLKRIGFELNGSHAEFTVVQEKSLVKIDKKIPFEQAAIVPDAVTCMYHAICVQGKVQVGDKICILGIGGLGLQGVQIAKIAGAEVYCTSRQDRKLNIAKRLGADVGLNTKKIDLVKEIYKLTDGEGCGVVFDNIGNKESVQLALNICRRGGKVIIVGFIDEEFNANFQDIIQNEKEIIGTRASNKQDLIKTVRLVEQGKITPYVSNTFPLKDINQAIEQLRDGKTAGRSVLIP